MSHKNKDEQLGMSYSSARHRLLKDVLFKLIVDSGLDTCYRCGKKISRDELSIDHKVDWLNSGKAEELFFDIENIAFSHFSCNTAASCEKKKLNLSPEERRKRKTQQALLSKKRNYDPVKRREQYLKHGH